MTRQSNELVVLKCGYLRCKRFFMTKEQLQHHLREDHWKYENKGESIPLDKFA